MIRQIKCLVIECDQCQKKYASGESLCDVFDKKEEAREAIEMDDWWEIRAGKVYCPDCQD